MTTKQVKERVNYYGFVEVSDILNFLSFLDLTKATWLGSSEYIYVRSKLEMCLRNHDDGSDYFIPLREFATELDCLIY